MAGKSTAPEGLRWEACPDCNGDGCGVCEGWGQVLVPAATGESTESVSVASTEREGERTDSDAPTPRGTLRGGHDPAEMARRGARLRRERKERQDQDAEAGLQPAGDDVRLIRVSLNVSKIVARLQADAAKGSTSAAKELRAWLSEVVEERVSDVSDLDRRTRQRLLARLLHEDALAAEPQEGQDAT